jgi:hypothetical protein
MLCRGCFVVLGLRSGRQRSNGNGILFSRLLWRADLLTSSKHAGQGQGPKFNKGRSFSAKGFSRNQIFQHMDVRSKQDSIGAAFSAGWRVATQSALGARRCQHELRGGWSSKPSGFNRPRLVGKWACFVHQDHLPMFIYKIDVVWF